MTRVEEALRLVSKKRRLNGRTFKELLKFEARNAKTGGSGHETKGKLPPEDLINTKENLEINSKLAHEDSEKEHNSGLKDGGETATETSHNVGPTETEHNVGPTETGHDVGPAETKVEPVDFGHDVGPTVIGHDVGPMETRHDVGPTQTGHNVGPTETRHDVGPMETRHEAGPTPTGHNVGPTETRHDVGPVETRHEVEPTKTRHDVGPVETGHEVGPAETGHNVGPAESGQNVGPTSRYIEYWVPVHLSNLQREQYCASLLSNSSVLTTCSKDDSPGSLQDIVITSRKCCDHPYLVDYSIRSSVIKDIPIPEQFSKDIELSGKMQLLDKILSQIYKRRLKVVILFQNLGSSWSVSLGDMLDDLIFNKYGENSYVRIDTNMSRSSTKSAAKMFNKKDNRTFVCLIETQACSSIVKLKSVDSIIIFNSDWVPVNDLRAVKKLEIQSQFKEIKVFRFYSCFTVEEKVLVLAKKGVVLDTSFKCKVSFQKLISWGACYQFSEDEGLECNKKIDNVLREVLFLLPRNSERNGFVEVLIVSEVRRNGGGYFCKNALVGEVETELTRSGNEPPHVFWRNILWAKRSRWQYLPDRVRTVDRVRTTRRKVQYSSETRLDRVDRVNSVPRFRNDEVAEGNFPVTRIRTKRKLRNWSRKRKYVDVSKWSDRNDVNYNISRQRRRREESITREKEASSFSYRYRDVFPSHHTPLPLNQEYNRAPPPESSAQPQAEASAPQPPPPPPPTNSSVHHDTSGPTQQQVDPTCSDPLQTEMNKILKRKDQTTKLHEEMKLQLQSECEKEKQEIQKKYDLLLQKAELEYSQKNLDTEKIYSTIYANKLLAGAMFLKHNMNLAPESQGTTKVTISDFLKEMSELYLTSAGPTTIPSPDRPGWTNIPSPEQSPRPSPPTINQIPTRTFPEPSELSLITTTQSRPVFASDHRGQLSIPTVDSSTLQQQVNPIRRAPAPHLTSTRQPIPIQSPGVHKSSPQTPPGFLTMRNRMPISFQDD